MGRRGPPPAPTALKLLHGETRPSRINTSEPRPLRRLPEQPANLVPGAAAVWDRALAELGHTGVLTGADREVLRLYAEAVVRYEQAATLYAATGPLIVGARRDELVKNPLAGIVRDLASQVLLLARELGLSPSARSGIHAPETDRPGDRLAAFLGADRRG